MEVKTNQAMQQNANLLSGLSGTSNYASSCPNCGYCPHCGRGGQYYRPYNPYYPYQPYPYFYMSSGNTGGAQINPNSTICKNYKEYELGT